MIYNVLDGAIEPAFVALPKALATDRARVLMLAIGLQESNLQDRRQKVWRLKKDGDTIRRRLVPEGPAAGLWGFEEGTQESRGGVWGVFLHPKSVEPLRLFCRWVGVPFGPSKIWGQLENNDVLAAGVARLLLFTDPKPLPNIEDREGMWEYYLRNWRPGIPRPEHWAANHLQAVQMVFDA